MPGYATYTTLLMSTGLTFGTIASLYGLQAGHIHRAQFSVLVVIEANPGLSQADLGETLGIERARLVRLLDGLEKRGLTGREPSPIDRRSHALFLTEDGEAALKPIKALAAEHEAHLTQWLGRKKHDDLLEAQ